MCARCNIIGRHTTGATMCLTPSAIIYKMLLSKHKTFFFCLCHIQTPNCFGEKRLENPIHLMSSGTSHKSLSLPSLQFGCLDVSPFSNWRWERDFFGTFVPPSNKLLSKNCEGLWNWFLHLMWVRRHPCFGLRRGEHLTRPRLTAVSIFGLQQHVNQQL